MRIVLDTNVLISGIFFGGVPHQIIDMWSANEFDVYVTPMILHEYQQILSETGVHMNKELSNHWSRELPKNPHDVALQRTGSSAARAAGASLGRTTRGT